MADDVLRMPHVTTLGMCIAVKLTAKIAKVTRLDGRIRRSRSFKVTDVFLDIHKSRDIINFIVGKWTINVGY